MGAVRMIKHHNNPHPSSPSVNILRKQKLHVCKKQIHNCDVFNFKPLFLASLLFHFIGFFSE